jgi:WD40 repeat protein
MDECSSPLPSITQRALDARTERRCASRGGLEHIVHASFSPDGQRLVTGSDDWNVQIWDIRPRGFVPTILHHAGGVSSVAFSPRGDALLTTSFDKTARLWDARTGQPLGQAMQHQGALSFGEFSPDGARLATASRDGTARVWNARSEEPGRFNMRS